MGDATDLHGAAVEYLAACVTALDSLTAAGAQTRRYVSPGPPAWDCEQLTVHVGGAAIAATRADGGALAAGHRIALAGAVDQVPLTATSVRCAPVSKDGKTPPSPTGLESAAAEMHADLWAIWNYVQAQVAAGALFEGVCAEVQLDPALVFTTEGGLCGVAIPLRITLYGFAQAL